MNRLACLAALAALMLGGPTPALAQRGRPASPPSRPAPASPRTTPPSTPACREASRAASLSGASLGVGAASCLGTKNPYACGAAAVAGAKFASDYAKMRETCRPAPTVPPAPRR